MENTLQSYINLVRTLVSDPNAASFSNATLTSFINQARQRVAMDTHCVRGFLSVTGGSALNTIPEQENYTYNGTIGGVTVTAGGANYAAPVVAITGGGGTGATAQAVVSGGVITAINMTSWGQNYTSVPTVGITDSTGTGATGKATLLSNVLDILSITVLWGNERVVHGWLPFTAFQTFCRQLTNQYNVPSIFTMLQGAIMQVFLFQIPDQAYTMEWDIITMPTPLVNLTDIDGQIIPPWDDAVQLYAAHLCYASLQNTQMADYWYKGDGKSGKYDIRIKQLAATSFSRRIFNPYRTYEKRIRRM